MPSGSLTALLAFSASLPASQAPRAGVASSMSSYSIVALPILLFTSSSAILKALTIVSVCPLDEPVRGRLETILSVPVSAAAGLGEAAGLAAGDAAGLAPGEAAGLAAGAAGLGGAGAAVGPGCGC